MPAAEYRKSDIGLWHLETALELYFAGSQRFSVLHLAGAAEEILGRELEASGQASALDTVKAATSAISQALNGCPVDPKVVAGLANRARNAVKHLNPAGPRTVTMDPEEEATDMLDRAITNYWRLTQDQTPNMMRFLRERYGRSG